MKREMRMLPLGALLGVALAANACDRSPTSPKTEPSVTAPSTPPGPPPPTPVAANVTVTGIVSGDDQPLANARVEVRMGERVTWRGVHLTTDASGRYRTEIVNASPLQVWVTAFDEAFRFQPCAAGFQQSQAGPGERTIDVRLKSAEGLSQTTDTRVPGYRNISGTIYTMTSTGKQPVAQAGVLWDLLSDDFQAWTKADPSGRFTLCNLPTGREVVLFAVTGAYDTYQQGWLSIGPGGDDVDVEVIVKRP